MKRTQIALISLALILATPALAADQAPEKSELKRVSIDTMAVETLERLFEESPEAGALYDEAVGYAVFDNFKITLILSGGGGVGVAVDRTTGARTYMKMGTGGIGVGLGGQSYQVVFMFRTQEAYRRFVNRGWQADASASAVAGTSGKNAGSTFASDVVVYQLTHKGLMAQADISGTKYWKPKRLNSRP